MTQYADSTCISGQRSQWWMLIIVIVTAQWWMLIVTDCLTGKVKWRVASFICHKPLMLQLLHVQSQRNHLSLSICQPWMANGMQLSVNDDTAQMHSTAPMAFDTQKFFCYLLCVKMKHAAVCHTIPFGAFLVSLFIMYQNGPKTTEIFHPIVPK